MKAIEGLLDVLLSYTSDIKRNLSAEELAAINLIYTRICTKIVDLHSTRGAARKKALEYFNSASFKRHCECVNIDEDTMLYIAYNPHKYLKNMGAYGGQDQYEWAYESHQ